MEKFKAEGKGEGPGAGACLMGSGGEGEPMQQRGANAEDRTCGER